jgi:hypothetical protein
MTHEMELKLPTVLYISLLTARTFWEECLLIYEKELIFSGAKITKLKVDCA